MNTIKQTLAGSAIGAILATGVMLSVPVDAQESVKVTDNISVETIQTKVPVEFTKQVITIETYTLEEIDKKLMLLSEAASNIKSEQTKWLARRAKVVEKVKDYPATTSEVMEDTPISENLINEN